MSAPDTPTRPYVVRVCLRGDPLRELHRLASSHERSVECEATWLLRDAIAAALLFSDGGRNSRTQRTNSEAYFPAELAKELRRSTRWVQERCQDGSLPHRRIGKRIVLLRAELEREGWLVPRIEPQSSTAEEPAESC
jgi:hypothetical protein